MTEQTDLYSVQRIQQRAALALAKIAKLAGYTVGLDEYWAGFYRVTDMPPAMQEEAVRQLEREAQVLASMGTMAQYGVTLGDKLLLYRTVIEQLQDLPQEQLNTAITWAQFKGRLNKEIRGECAKPIKPRPAWLKPRPDRPMKEETYDHIAKTGGDGSGDTGPVCGGRQPQDPAAQ